MSRSSSGKNSSAAAGRAADAHDAQMKNPAPMDELLNRAFQLAYFIHADKRTALRVAAEAAAKLEVAAVAQAKRLYYTPGGRRPSKGGETNGARTKVFLSDRHLLQRLVYIESEKYEREREESGGGVDAEQLLVHFVKHLVRVTTKRSSFYVALGLSRLLYNYTTAETMEIYSVVVQDPDRAKDDYYYRSRKGRLMEELKGRFGPLLVVAQGARGEERFRSSARVEETLARLTEEALRRFTPWNTPCRLPTHFDPSSDEVTELSTRRLEEEDAVEMNRMHTALHPECYERLALALRLAAPSERLALPDFSLPKGANDMNGRGGGRRPPFLSGDELRTIKDELSEQAARRKRSYSGLLSVVVDGRERARLDLARGASVGLNVAEGAELVEVYAIEAGERVLLATHLLDAVRGTEVGAATKSEIVLEGGQKLSFTLSPDGNAVQDDGGFLLTVGYRETAARRALARIWSRVLTSITNPFDGGARGFWVPALAVLLLVFCVSLYVLFRQTRPSQPETSVAEHTQTPSTPASAPNVPTHVPAEQGTTKVTEQPPNNPQDEKPSKGASAPPPAPTVAQRRVKRNAHGAQKVGSSPAGTEHESARVGNEGLEVENSSSAQEATRKLPAKAGVRSLSEVRAVYIEASGEGSEGQAVSSALAARVRADGRLNITVDKERADAALKVSLRRLSSSTARSRCVGGVRVSFNAKLVDEGGKVLWQTAGAECGATPNAAGERAGANIADELMKVLR